MSHPEEQQFCASVKSRFPNYFHNSKVLEIGSLIVNGSIRHLFTSCAYIGVDVANGPGVDVVSPGHLLTYLDGVFDTVHSEECFEHDQYFRQTWANMLRMLRPGGLMFGTWANTLRQEHGTRRSLPQDSPLTVQIEGWQDYYRNISEADVRAFCPLDEVFQEYEFVNRADVDLYFWGIKR